MVWIWLRSCSRAKSNRPLSSRVSELSTRLSTGWLVGELRTTSGGEVPAGMRRKMVCDTAVICVMARSICT